MTSSSLTISQIVDQYPATARVFTDYRIDHLKMGPLTIEEVCECQHLDPLPLYAALERERTASAHDEHDEMRGLPTAKLIAKIVSVHHSYLRQILPHICQLCSAAAKYQGTQNPKLYQLESSLTELQKKLGPHLEMEERLLFPTFLDWETDPSLVKHEVTMSMFEDHNYVTAVLNKIRQLSDDFNAPVWASTEYQTLMAELAAFDRDMTRHLHLENDVLLPRFLTHFPASVQATKHHQ